MRSFIIYLLTDWIARLIKIESNVDTELLKACLSYGNQRRIKKKTEK